MQELFFEGIGIWFSVPALVGTAFFLLRTVLMLVGGPFDLHHDLVLDADVDADLHHGDSSAAFKVLSIQSITAFMMGFGWGGLTVVRGWGFSPFIGVPVGIATGAAMVWTLAKLLTWIARMQASGTLPIAAALDEEATVYVKIPGRRGGRGSVRVIIDDRMRYYGAVTDGEPIKSRARVLVTEINSDNSLTVERIPNALPPSGA